MVSYTDGDVLTAPTPVIPVNLVGVMGAGLALQARQKWPKLFMAYTDAFRAGSVCAGSVHVWRAPTGQLVVLAPTKTHWRATSPPKLVQQTIKALAAAVVAAGGSEINVPPLGCGLGGLEPEVVFPWVAEAARANPELAWMMHRWPAGIGEG